MLMTTHTNTHPKKKKNKPKMHSIKSRIYREQKMQNLKWKFGLSLKQQHLYIICQRFST